MQEDIKKEEFNILDLTVEELNYVQKKAWLKQLKETFDKLYRYLQEEDYDKAEDMLWYSPGGDDAGCDNYYINFGYNEKQMDIMDVIEKLKNL